MTSSGYFFIRLGMGKILRSDSEYKIIEHPNGLFGLGDLSLFYTHTNSAFCCGTAELDEHGLYVVTVAAPLRFDEHSIREVAKASTRSEALKILWEQRLLMNWNHWM